MEGTSPQQQPQAPAPGTPEYEKAMAEKGAGAIEPVEAILQQPQPQQPAETQQRPTWLPEGFNTPEELATAYAALKGDGPKLTEDTQGTKDAQPSNFVEFEKEYAQSGSLSDASYAKLEKMGLSRAMVDNYIAGTTASVASYQEAGYSVAGGKEAYERMVSWAKVNLTPGEIKAFDSQVGSSDVDTMKLAVAGLNARYAASNGFTPKTSVLGSAAPFSGAGGFQSRAQVTAAMKDPRYTKDPAYRQSVERALANSNLF
jgi:hypothetical protein